MPSVQESSDTKGDMEGILFQSEFKSRVASKRVRLGSLLDHEIKANRHRGNTQHSPQQDIRNNQMGHQLVFIERRTKCKFPKCQDFTDIK